MLPLLLLCILISVYSPAEVCGKSQSKWRSNAPQNSEPKYQEPKSKGAVRSREKAPPNTGCHEEDTERTRKRNHGALYILKSEDKVELECNRSFKCNQQAVWYQTGQQHTYQLEIMNKAKKCVSNKVPVPDSGVFACHSSTGTDLCSTALPIVNIGEICEYDFFIVTKGHEAQRTHEEERESTQDSSDELKDSSDELKDSSDELKDSSDELKKPERTNITLSCNFTTDGVPFILYWIRAAGQPQCLYSVAGVDQRQPFLFNEHCCVHEGTSPRIYNHSDKHISAKIQKHNIEIRNATSSDSGHYLCIGARLIQETYQWEIVRIISLHVEKKNGTKGNHEGPLGNDSWRPILIAIGSVALICGLIVCLILLMRNKSKGKEVTGSSSTRNTDHPGTFENDECSPYAVGVKDKDDSAPEPYYTSVKTPQAPEYSLLEASTVTAPKSKTETSTVYALAQM